jgi:hypothetical protein
MHMLRVVRGPQAAGRADAVRDARSCVRVAANVAMMVE